MPALAAPAAADVVLRPLPAAAYPEFRRQVIFAAHKWDPQVGDVNAVADCAAILAPGAARRLAGWAETLAAETLALERAAACRPDLWGALGLPRALRRALGRGLAAGAPAGEVSLMRFDFHPTPEGWAVSEVNRDVPGGLGEASVLSRLAAALLPGTRAEGDVAAALVAAFARLLPAGGRVAFVHATSYSDDRQVMHFLGERFRAAGFAPLYLAPDHLRWPGGGRCLSLAEGQEGPVDGLCRFFPAEWLAALPRAAGWAGFFGPGPAACNHGRAILTQSKRLPLFWDQLAAPVPAWRALLPETREPGQAPWREDGGWLIKPALGRLGEGVGVRALLPAREWRQLARRARWFPGEFVAQRRFASRPLAHPEGERHLGVGVFTVAGRAAGFYGRLAARPRIDSQAQDLAVLVGEDQADGGESQ